MQRRPSTQRVIMPWLALAGLALATPGCGQAPGRESTQARASEKGQAARDGASNAKRADSPGLAASEAPPRMRLLVPAYFYPSGPSLDDWDRLIQGCSAAPIVIVLNTDSGPGPSADPNYTAVLRRAGKAGATVIGYVNTSYAKRPPGEARADIDRWVQLYPEVRGIFLDAQSDQAEDVGYYANLTEYAREKIEGALVVTNPGTICAEDYFSRSAMDAACVFEGDDGFDRFRLPAWSDRYPADRFAALPYRIGTLEGMRSCVRQAAERGIGLIYVTDASGDIPWMRLPRYWEAEVDAVRRVNQRQAP